MSVVKSTPGVSANLKRVNFSEDANVYITYDPITKTAIVANGSVGGTILLSGDNITLDAKQKLSVSMKGDSGGAGAYLGAWGDGTAGWMPSTNPKELEDKIKVLEKKIEELEKKFSCFDFELLEIDKKDTL